MFKLNITITALMLVVGLNKATMEPPKSALAATAPKSEVSPKLKSNFQLRTLEYNGARFNPTLASKFGASESIYDLEESGFRITLKVARTWTGQSLEVTSFSLDTSASRNSNKDEDTSASNFGRNLANVLIYIMNGSIDDGFKQCIESIQSIKKDANLQIRLAKIYEGILNQANYSNQQENAIAKRITSFGASMVNMDALQSLIGKSFIVEYKYTVY